MATKKVYALLDDKGQPVRYFDYPADGTIEIKEPKYIVDWNNYEECLL